MLEVTPNTTPSAATEAARPIPVTGRKLRRALHGASPGKRARVAADLASGPWSLIGLSPSQAARLCGVNPCVVTRALGRRGSRGPHRKTVERLAKYGPNALWLALDRATAPHVAAE